MICLFTGNSMELLGKSIGDKKALDIVPLKVTLTKNRYTGDVIVENKECGEIVGFINKCSIIDENEDIKLFDYLLLLLILSCYLFSFFIFDIKLLAS